MTLKTYTEDNGKMYKDISRNKTFKGEEDYASITKTDDAYGVEVKEDLEKARKKPEGHIGYTRTTSTGKVSQIKEKPYAREESRGRSYGNSDFILQNSDEIKEIFNDLPRVSEELEALTEIEFNTIMDGVEKILSNYDERNSSFVINALTGSSITARDIERIGIEINARYGTEPRMVIDAFGTALSFVNRRL